jgi:hypothetical protein
MKTEKDVAVPTQQPHLTIVSHSDNEHPEADNIIEEILQSIEVLTPLIVSIVSATQSKTITVPATVPPVTS